MTQDAFDEQEVNRLMEQMFEYSVRINQRETKFWMEHMTKKILAASEEMRVRMIIELGITIGKLQHIEMIDEDNDIIKEYMETLTSRLDTKHLQ